MTYESQEEHDHFENGEATMLGELGVPSTPQQSDWEKEFVGRFFVYKLGAKYPDHVGAEKEAVAFIKSLLQKERERMVSKMEGLKKEVTWQKIYDAESHIYSMKCGYNESLTDVINQIKS